MAKWLLQGTDKEEEGTEKGWMSLNGTRSRSFKDKPIVFLDDQGEIHEDIHNVSDARKAGLLPKKEDVEKVQEDIHKDVEKDVDEVQGALKGPTMTSEGMIDYTLTLGGFLNRREETKELTQMEIALVKEKETPGTLRYKQNTEDRPMTIYLA
jgi:hypothetical protein